jgi:hypothetical protein
VSRRRSLVSSSSDEPDAPTDETGFSLLRDDEAAHLLRRRHERPIRVGAYTLALLGSVTAAAGVALGLTAPTLLGVALPIFGLTLVAVGIAQFLLLRRDLAHWPDRALLLDGGVELVLHNGEVRGVSWTEADLALDLVARRAPPPADREFLLVWMTEGRIPSVELSAAGFARLRQAAESRRLGVTVHRKGRDPDGTQRIEIRPSRSIRIALSPTAANEATVP